MTTEPGPTTNRFPDGKLDATDEGELQMKVSSSETLVRLDFGRPIAWFALSKDQAAQLAVIILQHSGCILDMKLMKPEDTPV